MSGVSLPGQKAVVVRSPMSTRSLGAAHHATSLIRVIGNTRGLSEDSDHLIENRLPAPWINKPINCVHEGLASPEDIDGMMKLGANHPMGLLGLGNLIGPDVVLNIMETLYQGFDDGCGRRTGSQDRKGLRRVRASLTRGCAK